MKTWNQLFIRQGFKVIEVRENLFDCLSEKDENMNFILDSLNKANVTFTYRVTELILEIPVLTEEKWLQAVDFKGRGKGENLWFQAEIAEPKVIELDTYISGIVRELNRLKLFTNGSCDGHNR